MTALWDAFQWIMQYRPIGSQLNEHLAKRPEQTRRMS
jgi:hypothetical protein